jgi:uncharacterized integral membrane protein
MRPRLIVLVLAILLVAGFAALNWPEFTRSASVNFGIMTMDLPLGLILLGLLAIGLVAYLIGSASMETRYLIESRQHAKAMAVQRELADKAEASRFTELRTYLDTHLGDNQARSSVATPEFERALAQGQRDLRQQIEQMDRMLMARLAEIDNRLDTRLGRDQRVDLRADPDATVPRKVRTSEL